MVAPDSVLTGVNVTIHCGVAVESVHVVCEMLIKSLTVLVNVTIKSLTPELPFKITVATIDSKGVAIVLFDNTISKFPDSILLPLSVITKLIGERLVELLSLVSVAVTEIK